MKTFVSPIFIQTNQYAAEKIVCGLLAVNANNIYFKVSDEKLDIASKLSVVNIKSLIKGSLELVNNKVDETNSKLSVNQVSLFELKHNFNSEYIHYLSKYSSGLIQFSEPKPYNTDLNSDTFAKLFEKFVGDKQIEKPIHSKEFTQQIKKVLSNPELKEKADVNYQLVPNIFEGLLKQALVSMVTSNGAVSLYQSIDFENSEASIASKLYEFDAVQHSVSDFAKKKLNLDTKATIIAVEPKDSQSAQKELFDNVYKLKVKTNNVTLINPFELEMEANSIISTPHKKLSSLL